MSAALETALTGALDCAITLWHGSDDRVTHTAARVTTGWYADNLADSDRAMPNRYPPGEPDEEDCITAQVAALSGHIFHLADPDALDRADEISADALAITAHLQREGAGCGYSRPPTGSRRSTQRPSCATLALIGRVLNELADRLAYPLGEHLRLIDPHAPSPVQAQRPPGWWLEHRWIDTGNGILIHQLGLER